MEILPTGATGFLGSHLLSELIKKDHKVVVLKRSFSDVWRINHYLSLVQSITLKNFINKIEKIIGEKVNIKWGAMPYRKNEILDSKANINLAKELLNWQPEISPEEGLNNIINWHKRQEKC